ncbi:F-box/FBD/LRR-repeat protein At5g56420-like isoform X1 [Lotus japonicus]|uniref:F-box/FBD/LRR-repeat protein At5g56420-like isoform X1 n=1 Tax=Lotus japonicus TaxID=34305 RepID=UPI0025910B47|nr:F-box/FBD/LRR-repeat protein At5g56420-like isoform X1 [Lotus japonicus]XP_057459053.1 F-box/FBD/LRR-repeat protein At5g56420-like isoform X1 [Lotus japonicus]
MESTTKKEEENTGDVDRINSLPDSVLCHILSFLPTRTSVTTSLVCRRWRHLWEDVQVLNLCDGLVPFNSFAIFVNSVFTLRKCLNIRKFCLTCAYSCVDFLSSNSVSTWVRASIGPHLEELCLTLYSYDGHEFVVPRTLFTCNNLVSLSLCKGINIPNLSLVHLPSLKVLKLDIDSVDSIETLLHGCPVLETIDLSFSSERFTKLRFPPSLKRLNFVVQNAVGTYLEFDTACLNYLSITHIFSFFACSFGDLHRVVEAKLDVYVTDYFYNMLLKLLQALSGTNHLVLGLSTTKGLLRAPAFDFPKFSYLHKLELIFPYFDLSFMVNILEKCHMLRLLTILNQNEQELSNLQSWGQPPIEPSSHVLNLASIHYKGYQGFVDEQDFVAYVLRRCIILETIIISPDNLLSTRRKYKILKKLSELSRSSSMCELKFD